MKDYKPLIVQIEAWLQTFVEQNKNNDFKGCRRTLHILDKLYGKLEDSISDDLKIESQANHYKPFNQI